MEIINICFVCDKGYTVPTMVAMTSLKNNRDLRNHYDIYVLMVNVEKQLEDKFLSMTDKGFLVHVINIKNIDFSEYEQNKKGSICVASVSALLKFKLPEILNGIDKVLYLDGDVLINKDISELYNTNLEDYLAAVIVDSGSIYYKHKFVKQVTHYFNSGVMLLNLEKMREEKITDQLFDTKRSLKEDNLMDQNVFNIVFNNRIKLLSIKYNLLYVNLLRAEGKYTIKDINKCYNEDFDNLDEIKKEAYIIHYSSKDKPWINNSNFGSDEWYSYFNKSPIYEKRRECLDGYKGKQVRYICLDTPLEDRIYSIDVSVIIPVYNTKDYLIKSINSILNQSLKDIEIIIIDDGSTDGSFDVIKRYKEIDPRVVIVKLDKNSGQSVARNIGLNIARGKYVYFFDSDDLLLIKALEKLFHLAETNNADVVYFSGKAEYESDELHRLYPQYESYYKRNNEYKDFLDGESMYIDLVKNHDYNVSPCLQFIRTSFLKENNIIFYEGIIYEDNIFSFDVIMHAKKVLVIQDAYFIRNVRFGSTVTSVLSYKHYEGMLVVVYHLMRYLENYNSKDKLFYAALVSQIKGYLKQLTKIYSQLDIYNKNYIYRLEKQYRIINDLLINDLVDRQKIENENRRLKSKLQELNMKKNKDFVNIESDTFKNSLLKKDKASVLYSFYIMLYGGVKCYKEHGLKYTIKRLKEKIINK